MRSESGLGRKFQLRISEPCKGHFVNYMGRSEILSVLRFFQDSGLGALPFSTQPAYVIHSRTTGCILKR